MTHKFSFVCFFVIRPSTTSYNPPVPRRRHNSCIKRHLIGISKSRNLDGVLSSYLMVLCGNEKWILSIVCLHKILLYSSWLSIINWVYTLDYTRVLYTTRYIHWLIHYIYNTTCIHYSVLYCTCMHTFIHTNCVTRFLFDVIVIYR